MDDFIARLRPRSAVEIYLFLQERESNLDGGLAELHSLLRDYLYERLSIEEMEAPQALIAKLEEKQTETI